MSGGFGMAVISLTVGGELRLFCFLINFVKDQCIFVRFLVRCCWWCWWWWWYDDVDHEKMMVGYICFCLTIPGWKGRWRQWMLWAHSNQSLCSFFQSRALMYVCETLVEIGAGQTLGVAARDYAKMVAWLIAFLYVNSRILNGASIFSGWGLFHSLNGRGSTTIFLIKQITVLNNCWFFDFLQRTMLAMVTARWQWYRYVSEPTWMTVCAVSAMRMRHSLFSTADNELMEILDGAFHDNGGVSEPTAMEVCPVSSRRVRHSLLTKTYDELIERAWNWTGIELDGRWTPVQPKFPSNWHWTGQARNARPIRCPSNSIPPPLHGHWTGWALTACPTHCSSKCRVGNRWVIVKVSMRKIQVVIYLVCGITCNSGGPFWVSRIGDEGRI